MRATLPGASISVVSEPRAVATGSSIICHFPFDICHRRQSQWLSLGRGFVPKMANEKCQMENDPVATARASDTYKKNENRTYCFAAIDFCRAIRNDGAEKENCRGSNCKRRNRRNDGWPASRDRARRDRDQSRTY